MLSGMETKEDEHIFSTECRNLASKKRHQRNALPHSSHIQRAGNGLWHGAPMEIQIHCIGRGEQMLAAESKGCSLLYVTKVVLVYESNLSECISRLQKCLRQHDDIKIM